MKVLVTGSRGQIVQSLKERAAGWSNLEIVTLARPQADMELPGTMAEAIVSSRPDVVVNAAAYTAVDRAEDESERAFRINADGAGEAALAARTVGAPIIQISTDYVFDGSAQGPYGEAAPTNPLTVYGRSKLAGEARVRDANPDHLIVRTAWVYSPFGRNFVKTMMEAAKSHEHLSVVADQVGSPTSALDLADGLLTILAHWLKAPRRGFGEVYHLAGSGETSWCGLAEAVMAECARLELPAAEIRGIATDEWPTKARRPRNSVLDSGKFEAEFGFRLPEWRTSVADTVKRLAPG